MAAAARIADFTIGCPIRASLGVLGRKWSFLVLRDIAFYEDVRFSDILRSIDGITRRLLSARLRELQREGLVAKRKDGREITYSLTAKGADVMPILVALTRYGAMHHARDVFRDQRARSLDELARDEPEEILGAVALLGARGKLVRLPPPRAKRAATA